MFTAAEKFASAYVLLLLTTLVKFDQAFPKSLSTFVTVPGDSGPSNSAPGEGLTDADGLGEALALEDGLTEEDGDTDAEGDTEGDPLAAYSQATNTPTDSVGPDAKSMEIARELSGDENS